MSNFGVIRTSLSRVTPSGNQALPLGLMFSNLLINLSLLLILRFREYST